MNTRVPDSFCGRRRRLIAAAGLVALGSRTGAALSDGMGPVRPRSAPPSLQLLRSDGRSLPLGEQLKGGVTAVQLMFTGCSAVCPLQGALFASLQAGLAARSMGDVRLLSLSIDPLGDSPAALRAWLKQYGADARWSAAAPAANDLDRMLDFLGKRGQTTGDRHTTELHLFDREGRLAWRTSGLPPVAEVLGALQQLRA
ncbi:SCO family protein [Variovorax sp. PAMC 28711]|uniref:SCO family protein n=1 Tax=Variovorax sp. PAMC 28711 TaxID=1795631 RepID=UPI00078EEB6B|nr:SCO family protein [Variovorax sp. PAMC 28711]AMM24983.1 hypothetical protein AX767_11885 [Variovorax sp. PAMC 28711]